MSGSVCCGEGIRQKSTRQAVLQEDGIGVSRSSTYHFEIPCLMFKDTNDMFWDNLRMAFEEGRSWRSTD